MRDLEQKLADKFGWDCASLGANALADALAGGLIPANADLQEMAERLVVPETWFFRDTAPFDYLARQARAIWLPRAPGAPPVRILSAPCASGEEPYSIAMTLLDAGLPPESIMVDAVDVSARLLALARQGMYGERSFRETAPGYQARFFSRAADGRRAIAGPVRQCVCFHQANILDLDGCAGLAAEYQAIFCRNVLIYQHPAARRRMAEILTRRLAPAGLLFVGHAEMLSLFDEFLSPAPHRGAFAYHKKAVCQNGVAEGASPSGVRLPIQLEGERPVRRRPIPRDSFAMDTHENGGNTVDGPSATGAVPAHQSGASALIPDAAAAPPAADMESDLAAARRLADAGQTVAAETLCQKILAAKPLWPEAHLLAGLIRAATGRTDEAEACLRRAVYLDAHCQEALMHLALLMERRGDAAGAAILRRRLRPA